MGGEAAERQAARSHRLPTLRHRLEVAHDGVEHRRVGQRAARRRIPAVAGETRHVPGRSVVNGGRVLGWDLLRGLCALTVATYHMLLWLDIAELPALGTYGVYLFFVLSGASLAYNY